MAKQTLYMETTSIGVQRTVGEITSELVRSGAVSVNTDYKQGEISGLRWVMRVNGSDILFDMPARIDPVFKIINGRRKYSRIAHAAEDQKQAARVGWRQLLRWVQAQNAMIQTGMVEPAEVYLPYMVVHAGTGQTLFQRMGEQQFKAIEAPKQ